MLIKNIHLLVMMVLMLPLWAQTGQDEKELEEVAELNQLGLIHSEEIMGAGQTKQNQAIQQDNYASLFPTGIPEIGNVASMIQNGNNNDASLLQSGNGNNFGLLQDGNKNAYQGSLSGEDNLIRVIQRGNHNSVTQQLEGSQMNLEVLQEGNNHELIQTETAGNSPAYQVHQQGNNGMKVILNHEKVW